MMKNIVTNKESDSRLTPGASPSAGDGQIYKMKILVNKHYYNYNNLLSFVLKSYFH